MVIRGKSESKGSQGQGNNDKNRLHLNVQMRSPWISFKCLHTVSLNSVE